MNNLFSSYKAHRTLIGIMGLLLPFILLCNGILQESISAYYHTNMRDILVGVLCIVGVFLILYNDYSTVDAVISSIAGTCIMGVALFPINSGSFVGFLQLPANISGMLHNIFAGSFFASMASMSFFLFTKGKNKPIRTFIYRGTGVLIVLCLIFIVLDKLIHTNIPNLVFILETIMMVSFGTSWLIKGFVVSDKKGQKECTQKY